MPGRFHFYEGRAFYDPGSGVAIQVYSSDNLLRGSNYEDAQKMFLKDFGGLTKRSWGVDTMSAAFYQFPESAEKVNKGFIEGLVGGDKNVLSSLKVFDAKRNIFEFSTALYQPSPLDIYSITLTPALLMQLKDKEKTILYDFEFSPNDSLLGQTGRRTESQTQTFLAFRARTRGTLTQEYAKFFSLPASLVGQPVDFWWIIASSQPNVFLEQDRLYHFVIARFASDSHPGFLDDMMESMTFGH